MDKIDTILLRDKEMADEAAELRKKATGKDDDEQIREGLIGKGEGRVRGVCAGERLSDCSFSFSFSLSVLSSF
jgi:hypothetical protein